MLKYFAGRGFRSIAATRSQAVLGEGLAGKAALERQMVRIPDLAEFEEKFTRAELFSEEEFVTYYGVPLIARGELKGVLELFSRSAMPHDSNWSDFPDHRGFPNRHRHRQRRSGDPTSAREYRSQFCL
jgi:putative methionine-R-sulfoxide reductase with GAF domain